MPEMVVLLGPEMTGNLTPNRIRRPLMDINNMLGLTETALEW